MPQTTFTLEQVEQLLKQPNGFGQVLALVRDGDIDPDTAIEAINRSEQRLGSRVKRFFLDTLDRLLPS